METQQQNTINPFAIPGSIGSPEDDTVKDNDLGNQYDLTLWELKKIGLIVSSYFKMSLWKMNSRNKETGLVMARQIAMSLARKHTRYSTSQIGFYFGRRDHATVLHAVKVVRNYYDTDRQFRKNYDYLDKEVQGAFEKTNVSAYNLEVNHEDKTITVRTYAHFDYASYMELTKELKELNVDSTYKMMIL